MKDKGTLDFIHHSSLIICSWSWIGQACEAGDGADRAEQDKEIEKRADAQDEVVVFAEEAEAEQQKMQMIDNETNRRERKPARRRAEGARAREAEHGGD